MRKRVLFAAVTIIMCAFLFVACSEDLPVATEPEGYAVSGCVTFDGAPLEGVSVLVNAEYACATNEFGIYTLTGLEYGTVIAFVKEGYVFSPSSYTVGSDAYDLNVSAYAEPPSEDGDDSDGEDPDDGETQPPENPDEPESPEEPPALSVPTDFFAAYTANGSVAVGFAVDASTEILTLTANYTGGVLTSTAAIGDAGFSFDDLFCRFGTTENDDGTLSVTVDLTALLSVTGGKFSLSVTASAFGMEDGVSEPFACSFAAGAPSIDSLSFEDGMLSWATSHLPYGTVFEILANGIVVRETTDNFADLSDLLGSLPHDVSLCVAALSDGIVVAYSDALIPDADSV